MFNKIKKISSNIFNGKISVCTSCGFGEISNKPTVAQIEDYYSNIYWQNFRNEKSEASLNQNFINNLRANHQVEFIKKNCENQIISVLELGGGSCSTSLLLRNNIPSINIMTNNYHKFSLLLCFDISALL